MFRSSEFTATNRTRVVCEIAQRMSDAESRIARESSQIFFSSTLDDDAIHRLALWQISKHVLQWAEVKLLASRAFKPCYVFGILEPLQHLLIVLYRENHRDWFTIFRDDFRFHVGFHQLAISQFVAREVRDGEDALASTRGTRIPQKLFL